MFQELKGSFTDLIDFFKKKKFSMIFLILSIGLFAGWNGIQFIILSNHFYYFQDYHGLETFILTIIQNFTYYIPLSIFIIITGMIVFWFLHHWAEIELYSEMKKELSFKDKLAALINVSIPAFMFMGFVLFLIITLYLVLMISYFVLLAIGIKVAISLKFIMFKSLMYMLFLSYFALFVLDDFVLPLQIEGLSFTESLKKTWAIFKSNIEQFFFYYIMRYFIITISLIIFWRVLSLISLVLLKSELTQLYYVRFIGVTRLSFFSDYFLVIAKISVSLLLSFMLFAFISFPLYVQQKYYFYRLFVLDTQGDKHIHDDSDRIEKEESERAEI